MPKAKYIGPHHQFIIDDVVLMRDGDPVEITNEQVKRAGSKIQVIESSPVRPVVEVIDASNFTV